MPRSQTLIFASLNATRFLSIVALLLVFASSILVMVTNIKAVNRFQANRITNSTDIMLDCDYIEGSTVPNQPAGVFWAVVSSLLIIFQVIILLLSELGWPAVFFDRFFPVLGANFGLGALGIFQCLLGSQILSHRADKFPLVSAFFIFSIGCLNILLGLIFREDAKTKRLFRRQTCCEQGRHRAIRQRLAPGQQPLSPPLLRLRGSLPTWRRQPTASAARARRLQDCGMLRLAHPEENLPRYPSPAPSEESEYSEHSKPASDAHHEPAAAEWYPTPMYAYTPSPREPRAPRAPSPRSHRARRPSPSPARTASSRSASSDSSSSRSSSASSYAPPPRPFRETIHIPDSPRPESPPHPGHASPSRYGRNPTAF
ncbi:hypothetical protein B0H14DRAFT_3151501 [Mycena olivaceomarginata]|nr:hypothetical protein B0H14DRAFT_3151501 [Mycena olivaceomarginata]